MKTPITQQNVEPRFFQVSHQIDYVKTHSPLLQSAKIISTHPKTRIKANKKEKLANAIVQAFY